MNNAAVSNSLYKEFQARGLQKLWAPVADGEGTRPRRWPEEWGVARLEAGVVRVPVAEPSASRLWIEAAQGKEPRERPL